MKLSNADVKPFFAGLILLLLILGAVPQVRAQNEVAIGSATTKSNAILWLNGNGSQGLILPVVTGKGAVSSPDKGMIVYDDSDGKVWYRTASAWVEVGGGSGGSVTNLNLELQGNQLQLRDGTTVLNSVALASGTQGNGSFMVFQGGAWQYATLSGDVTGLNSALLVGGIKGKTIANLPASTQVLAYDPSANSGSGGWVFQPAAAGGGVTNVTGTAPVVVANGTTTPTISLANGGVTNVLLANGAVTSTKIQDATIIAADMADGSVSGGTGGIITDASITNADIAAAAGIAVNKLANGTNGQVLTTVGSVPVWQAPVTATDAQDLTLSGTTLSLTNDATPVTLGGLSILNSVSSAEITNSTITNVDVSNTAAIAVTKLANGTDGSVLTTVGGEPTWQLPAASADTQDLTLSGTTLSLTNDATPVALGGLSILNSVTSAEITNGTIANADVSNTAALAVTKLANGTNGTVLTTVGGVPTWQLPVVSTDAQDLTLTGTTLSLTNDATPVPLGGLSILSSVSSAEITNATIVNADISNSAAIGVGKLANGADGQVLTTVAGVPTWSAAAGGTVTNVGAGTGLTGGPITTTGTLSVDVGTTANKIVQLDGTGKLPAIDGSQLTNLPLANSWNLAGNTATSPGTDFIGTTDAQDLVFKTANTEKVKITAGGLVGIGTVAAGPRVTLAVTGKTYVGGDGSTGYAGNIFDPTIDLSIDDSDTGFDVPADGNLAILANNQEQIRVLPGFVGIGTTTPEAQLDIVGSLKITDGTQAVGRVLTSDANGLATWQPAGTGSGWVLSGNAGTTDGNLLTLPATGDFVGTTDATPLNFRVDNIESGRISADDNGGTYFGFRAGERELPTGPNPSPRFNTGFGNKAVWKNTTGQNNTGVGQGALAESNGSNNTAMGQGSLSNNTTGNNNTGYGALTLVGNQTGSGNTAIGEAADVTATNLTNATAIGFQATVNASNKVRIGNGSVTVIEGAVSYTFPSDIRLKKDVRNIDEGLEFINSLRPVSFRMRNGDPRLNWGFIAQEVEALLGTENALLTVGGDEARTLGLRYSDFVAPMVKSVQELNAKLEALEAENQKLKTALLEAMNEKEKLASENKDLESKVNTIQGDVDEIKRVLNISASKN